MGGNCCADNRKNLDEGSILFDELEIFKEKISKFFRLNPLYHYGNRRQIILESEYIKSPPPYLSHFFYKTKHIISKQESIILNITYSSLSHQLSIYPNSNILFFNIYLFLMSKTKNNTYRKMDLIKQYINDVFFTSKTDLNIDVTKLKIYIKSLIIISLTITINHVLLKVFESDDNIIILLESNDEKYVIDFIFDKIKEEINRNYSCNKLISRWEEYIIGPVIFAGYSNINNINNYNLSLRDEIVNKIADLFDIDKVINSFICLRVE